MNHRFEVNSKYYELFLTLAKKHYNLGVHKLIIMAGASSRQLHRLASETEYYLFW